MDGQSLHDPATVRIISAESVRKILKAWDFDEMVINSWYNDVEVLVEENDMFYVTRIAILCGMKHFHANLGGDSCHISDAGIKSLTQSCTELQAIDLDNCEYITDKSIEYIANSCPNLKKLGLICCNTITENVIVGLLRCCTQIETLLIPECNVSDKTMSVITECCPQLRALDVCSKILTNEPVIAFIESCRKVEDLVLHYRNMTTFVINTIAQNCPVLHLLDVECDQELSVDLIGTLYGSRSFGFTEKRCTKFRYRQVSIRTCSSFDEMFPRNMDL
uniref:F-box/LRR-repeat protein 15-like leucin rich repeat domain-containing protein n=1 Tax=Rhizophagus irregularis (strain DAOM 181602 / DAOM 197198 / MUCL 43194) TaxID=747089 RepID=U9T9L0_RHIID